MASVDKRPNGRYRTRWRECLGGPQKTRHFDRKGDAQQFLDGVRGDLDRGLYIDPALARTLFRDHAEAWRAGQVHRRSTAAQAETYLRRHAYTTDRLHSAKRGRQALDRNVLRVRSGPALTYTKGDALVLGQR